MPKQPSRQEIKAERETAIMEGTYYQQFKHCVEVGQPGPGAKAEDGWTAAGYRGFFAGLTFGCLRLHIADSLADAADALAGGGIGLIQRERLWGQHEVPLEKESSAGALLGVQHTLSAVKVAEAAAEAEESQE